MRRVLVALAALVWLTAKASASTCPAYPYTFVNGQVIDATQFNSNFTSILVCANTQLAPLASPGFTGTPTAPTAAPGTNTTQLATTAFVTSGAAAGANPTATAGPAAINGAATTFMRSDAAPAVQKGSAAQFGILEVDNTTITAAAGVITTANSSVAGHSVTPGGSNVAIAASDLSNGVTGSGAIVLATGPTISAAALTGAWNGDATSAFLNNVATSAGTRYFCFNSNSNPFGFDGNVAGCGPSDERLKTNWKHDIDGLAVVEALAPIAGTFDWKDDKTRAEEGRRVGLTAQAVGKVLPELVETHGAPQWITMHGISERIQEVESLDYAKLTVPLIVAVQQQQDEIKALKAEIAALKQSRTLHVSREVSRRL